MENILEASGYPKGGHVHVHAHISKEYSLSLTESSRMHVFVSSSLAGIREGSSGITRLSITGLDYHEVCKTNNRQDCSIGGTSVGNKCCIKEGCGARFLLPKLVRMTSAPGPV